MLAVEVAVAVAVVVISSEEDSFIFDSELVTAADSEAAFPFALLS